VANADPSSKEVNTESKKETTRKDSNIDYKNGSADVWDQLWKNQRYSDFLDDTTYVGVCEKIKFLSFRKSFSEAPGRKSLECGCGLATMSTMLAREGYHVTMLDLSAHALGNVKRSFEKLGLLGNFVQDDINKMPFEDNSFDLVLSFGVLEHFEDIDRPIKEMVRVLRPNGIFFADIVPNKFSVHTIANIINYAMLSFNFIVKFKFIAGYRFFKNCGQRYYVNRCSLGDYIHAMKSEGLAEIKSGGYGPFPSFALPVCLNRIYLKFIKENTNVAIKFNLSVSNLARSIGFGWWVTGKKSS
jgi:ubiquinone/menaquinone biosynthesis C-methylase UbiE